MRYRWTRSRCLPSRRSAISLAACGLLAGVLAVTQAAEQKFYADDPLTREPETQDASGAQPWDINLFYDLSYNLFVMPGREPANVRAQNVNTIDEVPDSSWFTNRIGARALTLDELVRGPVVGAPPVATKWTITREKSAGAAPGFTAQDASGQTFFVSFDPLSNPEGATGAVVVATKIFWALGYNQVEYFVTEMRRDAIEIAPTATKRRPSGDRTPLKDSDVSEILERANRRPDGSYRTAAGRLLAGKVLGGFKYDGTRSDDPNDIVPHEHRRELRALRVFGAWTNLTDMKAGNTLDTVVTEGGKGLVRHYLQDVGSTFGVGANGPHDWNEGWEYLYDGGPSRRRLFTFGFAFSPWQTADYEDFAAVGRFEGRRIRSPDLEAPRADSGLLRTARRRRVLGRAPGHGVFRRARAWGGEDGTVQRPEGRAAPRRRPHQAAGQDRPRVPHQDQSGRRSVARRDGQADVRERGRPVRLRHRAGWLLGGVVRLRQRDR